MGRLLLLTGSLVIMWKRSLWERERKVSFEESSIQERLKHEPTKLAHPARSAAAHNQPHMWIRSWLKSVGDLQCEGQ